MPLLCFSIPIPSPNDSLLLLCNVIVPLERLDVWMYGCVALPRQHTHIPFNDTRESKHPESVG